MIFPKNNPEANREPTGDPFEAFKSFSTPFSRLRRGTPLVSRAPPEISIPLKGRSVLAQQERNRNDSIQRSPGLFHFRPRNPSRGTKPS